MSPSPRYRAARVGGCVDAQLETRDDGPLLLRSTEPLGWYPARLTDCLEQWAEEAPERTFVARRAPAAAGGDWVRVSYAEMRQRARAIGQALTDRGLSVERPVLILSDNDLEHLSLVMGAMWAGVPVVPVSSAYSLVSQDFGKLRHIAQTVTPGLVFAASPAYGRAIEAVFGPEVEVVLTAFLLFVVNAAADNSKSNQTFVPVAIGFAITACHLVGLPITGCSINPTRSFASAAAASGVPGCNVWQDHWIFWLGPLAGGVGASVMYEYIFLDDAKALKGMRENLVSMYKKIF